MFQLFLFQESTNSNSQAAAEKAVEASQAAQNTIIEMANGFFAQLPLIAVGIIVFLIFFGLAYVARKAIKMAALKARVDSMLAALMSRIGYFLVIILGIFVAATVIFPGVNPGSLITSLGIGSVALGFAFKDVLQNLFAGFLILFYRPFIIGDQIKIDDFEGTVEEINVRATKIKTYDGERVVVPNNELYMKSVLVRTAFPHRRTKIEVGIGYGESHENARKILLDVLKNAEGVLDTPEPEVEVVALADSSVNMRMLFWTNSQKTDTRKASNKVLSATKKALDDAGIEIPFPQRVLTMVDNKFEVKSG